MEKIILVDGNNLLFRSYYATAYSGNFMKNSKDFPTNALFGFTNMMNKIINEEKPNYIMVAFDKGKTFRHDKYAVYKAGRIETPEELKVQFPYAKELLNKMGIKYYEIDNYEADDIIGTFSAFCDKEEKYIGTIISSDKDLLQLISSDIDIKLLKQKDYVRYNEKSFKEEYKIEPIKIIDLKALMGDPSDNIPGVKGIGEKTALKLLQDYGDLDNIYKNIDCISAKLKEKLLSDKDNAYMSYDIATIYKEVPININMEEVKYCGPNINELNKMYEELEFYSFLKKEANNKEETFTKIINNVDEIEIKDTCAIYLETDKPNYHEASILGMSIYNKGNSYFIPRNLIADTINKIKHITKYTYDAKKVYVSLKKEKIDIDNIIFDTMLAAYLLDYNVKEDIANLGNQKGYNIVFNDELYKGKDDISIEIIANRAAMKAKFIYETYDEFNNELRKENVTDLYYNIEFPLSFVLGKMEFNGINVDKKTLIDMGEEINIKIELLASKIYNEAGESFNISSPQQLSKILFEKIGLKSPGKKSKNGYSTAIDVLNKLKGTHPIVDDIIEYRALAKLYTTYIEGLINACADDGKIHTIYTQIVTRTGRLSSIEPNLQNIPIRTEMGSLIRKAFIPSNDCVILSGDYSQIELRILAHIAKVSSLINAFNHNIDIHTKTASDIFKVDIDLVNSNMRRIAKAVNFGIIYGISSYGLAENIHTSVKEAKEFIDNYLNTYPGIKEYMNESIKKAHEDGYVVTLLNRKRNIAELSNSNYMIRQQGERIALNTPIQGTSADIIKKAMVEIDKAFEKEKIKSKMILQIHDELIFDVYKDEYDKVYEIVKSIMENAYKLDVPLKVDLNSGNNWYQAK